MLITVGLLFYLGYNFLSVMFYKGNKLPWLYMGRKREVNDKPVEQVIKFSLNGHKQRNIYNSIIQNTVTLVVGPPGSGKTMLATYSALSLLFDTESDVERVIITRLAVETCGERIGALPGGTRDKLGHLLDPILDNLYQMYPPAKIDPLIASKKIDVIPISFLRGRSFHNSIIILDEAQSLTYKMMLTVLTRISFGSKLVILGDPEQCDVPGRQGLLHAERLIKGLPSCAIFKLDSDDVQRHPLVKMIVERSKQLKDTYGDEL